MGHGGDAPTAKGEIFLGESYIFAELLPKCFLGRSFWGLRRRRWLLIPDISNGPNGWLPAVLRGPIRWGFLRSKGPPCGRIGILRSVVVYGGCVGPPCGRGPKNASLGRMFLNSVSSLNSENCCLLRSPGCGPPLPRTQRLKGRGILPFRPQRLRIPNLWDALQATVFRNHPWEKLPLSRLPDVFQPEFELGQRQAAHLARLFHSAGEHG